MRIRANRAAEFNELCHVYSTFAQLDLRDKCLPLPDSKAEFSLRYSGVLPRLNETVENFPVEV
jgi:hypothetical protein